jgi:hypothetical protein
MEVTMEMLRETHILQIIQGSWAKAFHIKGKLCSHQANQGLEVTHTCSKLMDS